MGDIVVLIVGASAPVVFAIGLTAFLKRRRKSGANRWYAIAFGNLLVLLFVLSLLFIGGECYYRYCYDATDSFTATRTGHRWYERHFIRNNAGFRDSVDYGFDLKSGLPRISFIGDSFTAGHGIADVEQRFGNRVRKLARGDWEVHVLAESGRDTDAELKLISDLRRQRYQWDNVVLVYCINDVNYIVSRRAAIEQESPAAARSHGPLVEHSFLINTFYYRLRARFDPTASHYYEFVRSAYEDDDPVWVEQRSNLIKIEELCQALDARLSVVLFPFVHVVGAGNEYEAIHEKLAQFWASREVPCLDLLPLFEQHSAAKLTVSRYDAHPNELAHELAAQAIFEWLRGQLDAAQ